MSSYKINKISEIDISQLSDFYKKTFHTRHKSLTNNWRWWYRVGYNKYEPLILSIDSKVVGQAGLLPVDLDLEGKKTPAIWFVDFAILPEFQGKGYGKILTKEWMKICPNQITFCNDHSLKIFEKFGWKNNLSTKKLTRPISPLKFFPVLKKFNFANNIFRSFINRKFNRNISINPHRIDENFKIIKDTFKLRKNIKDSARAKVIRDEKWLYWRLFECPYKKDIYFFEHKNNFAIVHIYLSEKIKRLNVIYTYSTQTLEDDELLLLIMNWSINNNIDQVWLISESKKFENIFPKVFSKSLNFATWSSDKKIFQILQNGLVDSQGIDSDTDSSLYIEDSSGYL